MSPSFSLDIFGKKVILRGAKLREFKEEVQTGIRGGKNNQEFTRLCYRLFLST